VAFLERALALGVKPVADPFVFNRSFDGGTPWRPDLGTRRSAKIRAAAAHIDAAGAPLPDDVPHPPIRARLHDVRHYVATELLAAGVPAKTVGSRLGHTRVATTTDLCGHAMSAGDQASAALLEDRLG
jgi:integrase